MPEEVMALKDLVEDGLATLESVADAMEQIKGDLSRKLNSYGKILAGVDADIAAVDAEIKRLQKQKKQKQENRQRMVDGIVDAMMAVEEKKVETQLFTFQVKNSAESVIIDAPDDVPDMFYVPAAPKLDKTKLKSYLKDGNAVDYAHLEKGRSLSYG